MMPGPVEPEAMTYTEAIDWLYGTQQFGIKLGLEQPRRLLRDFEAEPGPGVKVIHVAGTNGKGSTCAMIDAIARSCGVSSGLFTSPHLVDFKERIRVNGDEISEQQTTRYLSELRELVSNWETHPTFFEITLALGMRYFRQQGCELIVLETGMGGRLDATTAVPADVAVITPIGMDHSQWLGETLAEIAAEKAGIIVRGKPVLSSAQQSEAEKVIQERAQAMQAPIEFITQPHTDSPVNLPGRHQLYNAALAVSAARQAELPVDEKSISKALANVHWPGRFERCNAPLSPHGMVLDAAHNPHAAQALVRTWQNEYPGQRATIVFGAVEGKNTDTVLAILASIAGHIHLTPIASPRSLNADELARAAGGQIPCSVHEDLATAVDIACRNAPDSPLLICGSIFLIGEIRAMLASEIAHPSSQ
ncbi:MAG: bifunctional folylpolyglutamate synthase/dihydrofolate synthase [Akkermansiaceae bacterium]